MELQKLLLLEDDIGLIDGLIYSLEKNGFEILHPMPSER